MGYYDNTSEEITKEYLAKNPKSFCMKCFTKNKKKLLGGTSRTTWTSEQVHGHSEMYPNTYEYCKGCSPYREEFSIDEAGCKAYLMDKMERFIMGDYEIMENSLKETLDKIEKA